MRPTYACDISYYVIYASNMNWTISASYTAYNVTVNDTDAYYPRILARDSAGRNGASAYSARQCFALDGECVAETRTRLLAST